MKNNKPTLTVSIPAYNEESNIEILLQSLLEQKQNNFILNSIVIHTDASTDKTVSIVKRFAKKHPLVSLHENHDRKGKYFRVNQIFNSCESDILVVLDADIALVGDVFLESLTSVMITDREATLVSAHQVLLKPKTFIGNVLYTSFTMWDYVRLSIPNYDSALNYFGSATAYRGSFARSITIPTNLLDPHLFIYLMAKKRNGFRYCMHAQILQWPISTIKDLEKFLRRSIGKKDEKLEEMFGITIAQVYAIPRWNKLIGIFKSFLKQPLYTPLALGLSWIMAKKAMTVQADRTPVWDIVTSTKKPMIFSSKK